MTHKHTIEEQKEIAQYVLNKLEIIDPCCILAGGAPRDWKLGAPANDLDFYLYLGHNRVSWTMDHQMKALGFENMHQLGFNGDEFGVYASNPNIVRVYEAEHQGMRLQFAILCKPTFGIVETFPFNMCQAWWKGGDKIHTSKSFQIGEKLGILFKCGDTYAEEDRYIEKIKTRFGCGKYPGYTYVTTRDQFLDEIMRKTGEQ